MQLVIAEKPSVAQSIARVIGAKFKRFGHLEGNGYLVSWCIGHLVELAAPEDYDEKYRTWQRADLPILPEAWKYQVSPGTSKQFRILKSLMEREDVTSIVCATDAGREGELIFRLVYQQCGCRKPVERLWISSMEDAAIREGFRNLKPSSEYDNLYAAALCRERADWMVGINATRLFSCLYGTTLAVGRVMTPTLGIAVAREDEIRKFRPDDFYTVELQLPGFTAAGERMKERTEADDNAAACMKDPGATVTAFERKERTERPPALYDLTTLQRDANRIFGYTAQKTLDCAQKLYEKKLITYPRTDSRYLTEDMAPALPGWIAGVARVFCLTDPFLEMDGAEVQKRISQVINNRKVSDHHAIIPTRSFAEADLKGLSMEGINILTLISCRLLVAIGEPYRYAETRVKLLCGGREFSAKGELEVHAGWKAIERYFRPALYGTEEKEDPKVLPSLTVGQVLAVQGEEVREEPQVLPSLTVGQVLTVKGAEVKEGQTTPPKRFTEDTLLMSMEQAGKQRGRTNLFHGSEKQEVMSSPFHTDAVHADSAGKGDGSFSQAWEKDPSPFPPPPSLSHGLGTPATRAGIIEKLVSKGLMVRKGDKKTKYLVPTERGKALISVMPEVLRSPALTADWEEKLSLIERGAYAPEAFMAEIQEMVSTLVRTSEAQKGAKGLMAGKKEVGKCPHCGAPVVERQKGWTCTGDECRFAIWKENSYFTKIGKKVTGQMVEKLLRDGRIRLKDCSSRKTGKSYNAELLLGTEEDGRAAFSMEFEKGGGRNERKKRT